MMGKRQRSDVPSWWGEIVQDVTAQGGFVHPSLEFSDANREMAVDQKLPEKTLVLRIPRRSLVSLSNATNLASWFREVKESVDRSKLYNPLTDVLLAFSLASQKRTYLKTLPPASAWDCLPRRWSIDQMTKYLQGSPLLSRVEKDKLGVRSDYDLICDFWKGQEAPSFSNFDDMLAAVSSRAFADSQDEIVMIPILDLCNHSRGKGGQKNLTYKTLQDGSVEVTTSQPIEPYEGLRLTYGAQGNGQLLLNYGFTIPKNLEPDGSSNDFVEFSCDGVSIINLKTGPKAYTYGGFVKALEQTLAVKADSISLQGDEEDDMEAFLNGCDHDQSREIDIYDHTTEIEDTPDCANDNKEIQKQLEALRQLRAELLKRMDGYDHTGQTMRQRLGLPKESLDYFSALLLLSEQRCLYFFFRAAQKVESLMLQNDMSALELPKVFVDLPLDKDDYELMEKQTDELSTAYMKIRHGEML